MKRIDFENGTVTGNIIGAALPMLVAQILNLLYNIVDRIYIARIPEVGTPPLAASRSMFPVNRDYQCVCQSVWKRRRHHSFLFSEGKRKNGRQYIS